MNNEELDKLLKTWEPEMPNAPGFRRNVWGRIEENKGKVTLTQWVHETLEFVTRPAIGLPAAALVIALTAWLAVENGNSQRAELWTDLASIYHDSINPLNHSE